MYLLSYLQSIPTRRVVLSDQSQIPTDYSTTPGGTWFSTTPGGTRQAYNFIYNNLLIGKEDHHVCNRFHSSALQDRV